MLYFFIFFGGGGRMKKKVWKKNRKKKVFLWNSLWGIPFCILLSSPFLVLFCVRLLYPYHISCDTFCVFLGRHIFFSKNKNAKKRYKMLKKGIKMLYLTFSGIPSIRRNGIQTNGKHTVMYWKFYVPKYMSFFVLKSGPFWSFLTFFGPF